jgi:hypothetical protein
LGYLRIFRILQQTKQSFAGEISKYMNTHSLQGKILSYLKKAPQSLDSRYYPGTCIPYISFVFHAPKNLSNKLENQEKKTPKRDRDTKPLSLEEKLKQHLEQQLKTLLRRNKLDRVVGSGFSRDRER